MTLLDRVEKGVLHLRFAGDDSLDYASARQIRSEAVSKIDGSTDVVVDLSEVEFIDSAGLTVLVSVFKAVLSHDRRVRFVGVRPGVVQILRVIRLTEIFEIFEDMPSALASLHRRSA